MTVFPDSVITAELSYYTTKQMNPYGVPLDNRGTFTKLDWLCWIAAMGSDQQQAAIMKSIYAFANQSPDRMALSDLYYTTSGTPPRTSCPLRCHLLLF